MRAFLAPVPALALLSLVVACAGPRDIAVQTPPPQPRTRPVPPAGAAAGLTLPPLRADGLRQTPNGDLTATEAVWHLRMALNVAALLCRPADDSARLNYNAFLSAHRAALARANTDLDAAYKAKLGSKAVAWRDTRNTAVYNFFAQPPATDGFCAAAIAEGARANALPSAELRDYAPGAIQRLEQPFQSFYAQYAAYQQDLAAWNAGGAVMTASAAPAAPARAAPARVARLELDLSGLMNDDSLSLPRARPERLARSR